MGEKMRKAEALLVELESLKTGDFKNNSIGMMTILELALRDAEALARETIEEKSNVIEMFYRKAA